MAQQLKTLLSITLRSLENLTSRVVIETLQAHSDLTITPPDEYNFADNTVACYRYQDGTWRPVGRSTPHCDVWIIWIDGYALDHRSMGFQNELEFFYATQEFFQRNLDNGNVGAMYNHPQTERNTLKDFLADLDSDEFQVIPSYLLQDFDHLADIFNTKGPLVVKPIWGGQRQGVVKVTDELELLALRDQDLSNRVAQLFYHGPEKRLWITGGQCLQGCVHYGKITPWSDYAPDYRLLAHDQLPASEAAADVKYAERMAAKIGLCFGSVDFIGDRINEINGAGAGFVMWNLGKKDMGADARPLLQAEMMRLIGA